MLIADPTYQGHRRWMNRALELAQSAGEAGEVPVGAVIVDSEGQAIASASNRKERDFDPTAHAEIIAIRAAGQALQNWHLNHCTLYVTLEPCPMCAGAIVQARLGLLVYGVDDPKTGAIRTVANIPDSACSNHRLQVIAGVMSSQCRQQLQTWFAQRRGRKKSALVQDADFSVVSGSTHPVVSHPAHNIGGCSGNESPRTDRDSTKTVIQIEEK